MVGNRGLREADWFSEIAHAHLPIGVGCDQRKELHSSRVTERFEHLRKTQSVVVSYRHLGRWRATEGTRINGVDGFRGDTHAPILPHILTDVDGSGRLFILKIINAWR